MQSKEDVGPPPSSAWRGSFQADAYQHFLAGVKRYWGGELYRDVVAKAAATDAQTPAQLEDRMRDDAAYRLYAWLERRVQQLKWNGRWGFASLVAQQREALQAQLDSTTHDKRLPLQLDPALTLPDYVTEVETHQQPGGLWRDATNAYVLAWYTTGLSFAGSDPNELVDWYAQLVCERCAEIGLVPERIVDVGCTGGRSTRAIKRAIPAAALVGCDMSPLPIHSLALILRMRYGLRGSTMCGLNSPTLARVTYR